MADQIAQAYGVVITEDHPMHPTVVAAMESERRRCLALLEAIVKERPHRKASSVFWLFRRRLEAPATVLPTKENADAR